MAFRPTAYKTGYYYFKSSRVIFCNYFFLPKPTHTFVPSILAIHQDEKKNPQECGILAIFFVANILEGEYQNIKMGPTNSQSRNPFFQLKGCFSSV